MARRTSLTLSLALLAVTATTAVAAWAGTEKRLAGDPDRGALAYVTNGCGACHVFRQAGSSGASGPDLDRWPEAHAARLGLPTATFVRARIAFGGRGMPPFTELTQDDLDDLTSYVLGTPVSAPADAIGPVPPLPATPPLVTAPPATVKAWVKARRLKGSAARGARVLAAEGCLSCHRFLGVGVRRVGAPELSSGGPGRLGLQGLRALIAHPASRGNTAMPAYADLGNRDLRALADLLVAVRQPRR